MREEFSNNKLIKDLADRPIWTTNKPGTKMPVAPQPYITKGVTRGLRRDDRLVTLRQLGTLPANMPYVAKISVAATRVVVFDIEPQCVSDNVDLCTLLLSIPHEYVERSAHGGYHMLVRIDDGVYRRYRTLWTRTAINVNHWFELFPSGTHAITLTGNVVHPQVAVNPEALGVVLNIALRCCQDAPSAGNGTGTAYKRGKLQVADRDYVKSLAANVLRWSHLDFSKAGDVRFDASRFEFRVMSMLAARLEYRINNLRQHPRYQQAVTNWHNPSANEFVATLATLTSYVLGQRGYARAKWYTKRDGNYYLTFMACQWYGRYGHHAYGELV